MVQRTSARSVFSFRIHFKRERNRHDWPELLNSRLSRFVIYGSLNTHWMFVAPKLNTETLIERSDDVWLAWGCAHVLGNAVGGGNGESPVGESSQDVSNLTDPLRCSNQYAIANML